MVAEMTQPAFHHQSSPLGLLIDLTTAQMLSRRKSMESKMPPIEAKTETGSLIAKVAHLGEWKFSRTLLFVIAVLVCLQEGDKASRRSWTNLLRTGIDSTN